MAGEFLRYFVNSLYIALITTATSAVLGVMAGIGFSRYRFRGSQIFSARHFGYTAVPSNLARYALLRSDEQDGVVEYASVPVITYCAFTLPFCVWMLNTYFSSVPIDMEESAMIDGCTRLGAYFRITIPLAAPGIAATGIFAFVLAWNEFVFANTFLDSPHLRTLPIGLRTFIGEYSTEWNVLMAASVITTLPVVMMFIFMQKHFIRGMTAGSIKG